MKNLVRIARAFFGLGIAGMGVQQFIYAGFRPVFISSWPQAIGSQSTWAYVMGSFLVLAGVVIAFVDRARFVSILLGFVFLLLFLCCHVPFQLQHNKSFVLGGWINPLKELALAGSSFIIAVSFIAGKLSVPDKFLLVTGRLFFAVMLIIFGYSHFVYKEFVVTLVPGWIPGHSFWTYFGAVALIGSGICILLKLKIRLVSILLGTMLLLWVIILHIPRAIDAPPTDKGNELTSVFQALAFSGVAFALYFIYQDKSRRQNSFM